MVKVRPSSTLSDLFRTTYCTQSSSQLAFSAGGRRDALSFTTLALDGMSRTDIAVREWFGLIAYRVTGQIDDLLPGSEER
jgi:hypothetical protein